MHHSLVLSLLFLNTNRSAKVSRKPPHAPQRSRANYITPSSQLPQAFLANKREEKELEKKLIALETEEEEKLKTLTKRQHKIERESLKQKLEREVQTRGTHRARPKHGDNKWKRNLALARYPTPPETSLINHSHHETRRSSCDFHFSGSSDSSQEDGSSSNTNDAMPSLLQPPTPHPHFTSSSTNCSPIYRRRTIPTIMITDMDRRRLSPLMLRNQDYMERVQELSHSMPTLFRNDNKSKSLERGTRMNGHPALEMERCTSRPGSSRSSVVKLPPISPHPLTASCNNSTKAKELTSLRTTLFM